MSTELLHGKVAIITGGSTGIGQTAALLFARYGAKVVIADINLADGESTAQQVQDAGGTALFVATDVTKAKQVEALVHRTVARFDRLDCAFNNAGIDGQGAPTADCTEENWERVLAVNLRGVFLCMKYQLAQMLKQGAGAIVNNASAAGLIGSVGLPAYVAAKHGVLGLTKAAALEYAKSNIRVNAICPGAIMTPMLQHYFQAAPQIKDAVLASHPIGRTGTATEVAEAAAWLCSDRSSFVLGHAMAVDGGAVAC